METLRSILVYLDPREESVHALNSAVRIASHSGASITAIDVVEEGDGFAGRKRQELLEERTASLKAEGIGVSTQLRRGRPALELTRVAVEDNHGLILKAARGDLGEGRSLFGPTAQHLMRHPPRPVWIVGPRRSTTTKILAIVDPTERTTAERILEKAVTFGHALSAEVHVLYAFYVPTRQLSRQHVPWGELMMYLGEQSKEAGAHLRHVVAPWKEQIPEDHTHLVGGRPEGAIPRFVRKHAFDMIIMGHEGRCGADGLLIGDAAEAALTHIDAGILSVGSHDAEASLSVAS